MTYLRWNFSVTKLAQRPTENRDGAKCRLNLGIKWNKAVKFIISRSDFRGRQLTSQCRRLGGTRCHSGYIGEKQVPAPRWNRTELFNSQSNGSESFGHQGLLASPLTHSMFLKRKIYNDLRTVHDSQKQRLACRRLSTVHCYRSLSFLPLWNQICITLFFIDVQTRKTADEFPVSSGSENHGLHF